ncbi:uncharacterized protein LOC143568437 [Bidens hawaiensis]|uniref:uncharacterized protein LOC143568437 n=1 Tax=Bidens hawaiensis TaxID=980011 RepID=UPI00404A3FC0
MEQIKHFSHEHLLSLVQLQPHQNNEDFDKEEEDGDEDNDDIVVKEDCHLGTCKMCEEEIYLFHLCYYSCNECDYSLHKFCAQLPTTHQNHPLHPGHNLRLSKRFWINYPTFTHVFTNYEEWRCDICHDKQKWLYNYHCPICIFSMDIICATISKQKMNHPSHHHQLQRYVSRMTSVCNACGNEHSGTFYHCTNCSCFRIHLDCALLPTKLLIQQSWNGSFSHSHFLTLAYCFPYDEQNAKFFPNCRVCEKGFDPYLGNSGFYLWHYRCDKCRYYVHVDCATSRKEAFMSSILMPAGFGKAYKNFKDEDHPNMIRCPFPDESVNLLTHLFINKGNLNMKVAMIDGERFSHRHPLVFYDTFLNGSVPLHDPMKRVELLCDGCVRPITNVPFYKCSQDCNFVLHEWCTRLSSQIQDHYHHPDHRLVFMPKAPTDFLGVFECEVCRLPCNGFAYGCTQCNYYVDINCGFVPDVITHEAHPNHLLLRFKASLLVDIYCKACGYWIPSVGGFHCPSCDFYLHANCALLLPRRIRHKYDKHQLSLTYNPVENHSSRYFCDICEDELNPTKWFYHCRTCASSMHGACAPLKFHCEQYTTNDRTSIFKYINVKFGGTVEIEDHPGPLTFVQGINADGDCIVCGMHLQYGMIFKCFRCKFALHKQCVRKKSVIRATLP